MNIGRKPQALLAIDDVDEGPHEGGQGAKDVEENGESRQWVGLEQNAASFSRKRLIAREVGRRLAGVRLHWMHGDHQDEGGKENDAHPVSHAGPGEAEAKEREEGG